jgi:hypothetical protein
MRPVRAKLRLFSDGVLPSPRNKHCHCHYDNYKRGEGQVTPPASSVPLTLFESMVEGQLVQPRRGTVEFRGEAVVGVESFGHGCKGLEASGSHNPASDFSDHANATMRAMTNAE